MIERFDDPLYWLNNHILPISKKIDEYISRIDTDNRNNISENIITYLRHFIEAVSCYVSIKDGCAYKNVTNHRDVKNMSLSYIAKYKTSKDFYLCLNQFHSDLQKAISHEAILYGDYAERLMLKYFNYLIRIKTYFNTNGISILSNLKVFPLSLDKSLLSYYRAILTALNLAEKQNVLGETDLFYINDKKTVYIDNEYFYEYTLSVVDDNKDKGSKIIAFSKFDYFGNYAMKLSLYHSTIKIFGVFTSVEIIRKAEVQIRDCEFEKLSVILGLNYSVDKTHEYFLLARYIEKNMISLGNIVQLNENDFKDFMHEVFPFKRETKLKRIILTARNIVVRQVFGKNTLLYLLATMNNHVLSSQLLNEYKAPVKSELVLPTSICPFEKTPFCADLPETIIIPHILFETIDIAGHECELIKRKIDNETRENNILYCHSSVLSNFQNLDENIKEFNSKIDHYDLMVIEKTELNGEVYYYVKQNESNLVYIIDELLKYHDTAYIRDFRNFSKGKINLLNKTFEDKNKEDALIESFNGRHLYVVYGPAGTGKTYFINELLDIIEGMKVLCLSSTYASLGNLKRRLANKKANFFVAEKVVKSRNDYFSRFNMVIIDECSTISNADMKTILSKIKPDLLLLVGDEYQIESVQFGNWFSLLQRFLPEKSFVRLDNCFRTSSSAIKEIWNNVRDIRQGLSEMFKNYMVSKPIDEEFFRTTGGENSITLCLNYAGLYGINNINKILQSKNRNHEVRWRDHAYKVGDPIVFRDTYRFKDIFYNNLKGKILEITRSDSIITFKVEAFDILPFGTAMSNQIKEFSYSDHGTTILSFDVGVARGDSLERDIKPSNIVPFTVCYAMSIHKAQGLEFDKVDVVISGEIKEVISHNVFYTAITRAVRDLNIYWSPETENSVISNFEHKNYKTDLSIIHEKYPYLKRKIIESKKI